MKKFTVDYFINKFNAIPHEKWTIGMGEYDNDSTCALGHCGSTSMPSTKEAIALAKLLFNSLKIGNDYEETVYIINDCKNSSYGGGAARYDGICELGDSPKERILNALELVKAGVKV